MTVHPLATGLWLDTAQPAECCCGYCCSAVVIEQFISKQHVLLLILHSKQWLSKYTGHIKWCILFFFSFLFLNLVLLKWGKRVQGFFLLIKPLQYLKQALQDVDFLKHVYSYKVFVQIFRQFTFQSSSSFLFAEIWQCHRLTSWLIWKQFPAPMYYIFAQQCMLKLQRWHFFYVTKEWKRQGTY